MAAGAGAGAAGAAGAGGAAAELVAVQQLLLKAKEWLRRDLASLQNLLQASLIHSNKSNVKGLSQVL